MSFSLFFSFKLSNNISDEKWERGKGLILNFDSIIGLVNDRNLAMFFATGVWRSILVARFVLVSEYHLDRTY